MKKQEIPNRVSIDTVLMTIVNDRIDNSQFSHTEIFTKMGMTQSSFSKLLNGGHYVTMGKLFSLCDAVKIDVAGVIEELDILRTEIIKNGVEVFYMSSSETKEMTYKQLELVLISIGSTQLNLMNGENECL